jgi:HK97 gp10 family phage protein
MAKVNFKIVGMKELQKSLKKLSKVPQKHVTASARKGMTIIKKGAKTRAPEDTGALKKGIILKPEKSKYRGKKVYKVVFDPAMNDIFQKGDAYYPASQEYGFFAKNGRYIPGFRFIHNSLTDNAASMEKTIVDTMKKKIDNEISKGGLK